MIRRALATVTLGAVVFPVYPIRKSACACPARDTCEHPGKHPLGALAPHGRTDATRDEAMLRAWWRAWVDANLGVATGPESGFFVVDVDPRHDGDATLRTLEIEHGALPETWEMLTGGGGRHLYFRYPADVKILSRDGALGPGVDVKGAGGYVLGEGSSHISGRVYTWEAAHHPDEVPLADAPAWLLAAASAPTTTNGPAPRFSVPETIPEGTRNVTMFALARSLRIKGLSPGAILKALIEENAAKCSPPMPDAELADIVQHAVTAPDRPDFAPARTDATAAPPLTDAGNAQRFAAEHGVDLRYCYPRASWFVFAGPRWVRDDGDRVMVMAKATARTFLALAATATDDTERKRLARWGLYSQSEPGLRRMLALAQSEPGIPVAPHALDADPWLVNFPNGTVDLRGGALRPHRREDLLTKMTAAPFDPAAQHPVWTAFLETALPDPDSRAYAQRWAGYCLTGDVREECFVFLLGPTGGGKTTFSEALRHTWGDYGMSADMSTFLHRKPTDGPRDDIARLADARLVTATETRGNGSTLAEGFLKLVSGGDTLAARRPYERTVEFTPRFKLLLAANDRPRASADDAALWRRLRELPFPTSRPRREDRDDSIKRTLTDPAQAGAAILAWAVAGCLAWQRGGLGDPPAVTQATDAYRRTMDRFADFLGDRCVLEPAAWLPARELRGAYETWASEDGQERHSLLDGQRMGERLRLAGCRPTRKSGARAWIGIRLRGVTDDETPEASAHPAEVVTPW